MVLWSIGHSTHDLDTLVALLRAHGIGMVADIRTVPKSRRHPHFRTEALAESLPARGIDYRHLARLGGWRRAAEDSPNAGWRNVSFRGYADHLRTDAFAAGFAELTALATEQPTAMMCSEALWWRCHRRLVADHAVAHGHRVLHIAADGRTSEHALTDFAHVGADGGVTYPAPPVDED